MTNPASSSQAASFFDAGTSMTPREEKSGLIQPVTVSLAWDNLQKMSKKGEIKIPGLPIRRSQDEEFTHLGLRWIYDLSTPNKVFNLKANRMKNPGDRAQEIAAFHYPRTDETGNLWRAIAQHKYVVFNLSNAMDEELSAAEYRCLYPKENSPLQTKVKEEAISVSFSSMKNGFHIYNVTTEGKEEQVAVYHYPDWKDNGVISIEHLDGLVDAILPLPKVAVHCLAGLGRTGTLITAAFIKRLVQTGKLKKEAFTPNWLMEFVYELRKQRAQRWVRVPEQFNLLYEYGLSLFK